MLKCAVNQSRHLQRGWKWKVQFPFWWNPQSHIILCYIYIVAAPDKSSVLMRNLNNAQHHQSQFIIIYIHSSHFGQSDGIHQTWRSSRVCVSSSEMCCYDSKMVRFAYFPSLNMPVGACGMTSILQLSTRSHFSDTLVDTEHLIHSWFPDVSDVPWSGGAEGSQGTRFCREGRAEQLEVSEREMCKQ